MSQPDVLGAEERRDFAQKVVKYAISIYTRKIILDTAGVSALSRYLPGVAYVCPTAAASWEEQHERIAELLYCSAMRVGGIAVKALQFVGLRDDMPEGYRKWFAKAQESTSIACPPDYVEQVLAGVPGLDLEKFDRKPLKSASIAQVHKGEWEGKAVAVKVLHPNVRAEYLSDLAIMADIGDEVNQYEEAKGAGHMLRAIAEKLKPTAIAETDFTKEKESQEQLRDYLSGKAKIAEVFYWSEQVLIMEWLHGRTGTELINAHSMDSGGEDLDRFGRAQRDAIFKAYALMIFEHGFFQMDAHPGNFMALDDGGVAIMDFGQCCEIDPMQKNTLAEFVQTAPSTLEQVEDASFTLNWLSLLGVQVTPDKAVATAKLLIFGAKSTLFPVTMGLGQEWVPILLIFLYLSRFENTMAQSRIRSGLPDEVDNFAVLSAFRQVSTECAHNANVQT